MQGCGRIPVKTDRDMLATGARFVLGAVLCFFGVSVCAVFKLRLMLQGAGRGKRGLSTYGDG